MSLWRRPACYNLLKALDISSAIAQIAPDLSSPSNSIRFSPVFQEELKPYWKSENRPYFSRWTTSLLFTSFSKILLTTERGLTGQQFLDLSSPFSKILRYWGHRWDLSTIRKTRCLQTYWRFYLVCIKFRLTLLQNHHWDTFTARSFWWFKAGYDLFNQLGSYRNII